MICRASSIPETVSYDANYFNPPLSETDLMAGKGLTGVDAQEKYHLFSEINDRVLQKNALAAQDIRNSDDVAWIEKYKPFPGPGCT